MVLPCLHIPWRMTSTKVWRLRHAAVTLCCKALPNVILPMTLKLDALCTGYAHASLSRMQCTLFNTEPVAHTLSMRARPALCCFKPLNVSVQVMAAMAETAVLTGISVSRHISPPGPCSRLKVGTASKMRGQLGTA